MIESSVTAATLVVPELQPRAAEPLGRDGCLGDLELAPGSALLPADHDRQLRPPHLLGLGQRAVLRRHLRGHRRGLAASAASSPAPAASASSPAAAASASSAAAPDGTGRPTLNSATAAYGVSLAWSAPTSNGGSAITGYNLYRGTSTGGEIMVADARHGHDLHRHRAHAGVAYFYKVTAVNAAAESVPSGELSATPLAPPTAPGAPTLDSATPGNAQVTLAWTVPSNGGSAIQGYNVYRGTTSGGET